MPLSSPNQPAKTWTAITWVTDTFIWPQVFVLVHRLLGCDRPIICAHGETLTALSCRHLSASQTSSQPPENRVGNLLFQENPRHHLSPSSFSECVCSLSLSLSLSLSPCVCANVRACVCVQARAGVRACVCIHALVCVCQCVCVCLCVCV